MESITIENGKKLFFTSDSHFGHANIIRYCQRPFSSKEEMNEGLISKWNETVPEDGIVVHCGDMFMNHCGKAEMESILNRLNGRILLTRGNHDAMEIRLSSESSVGEKMIAICDMALVNCEGLKIIACHYPLLAFPFDFDVFGHVHTGNDGKIGGTDAGMESKLDANRQYDVGVDRNGYAPVPFATIRKMASA